jgi:predicted acyl esterase
MKRIRAVPLLALAFGFSLTGVWLCGPQPLRAQAPQVPPTTSAASLPALPAQPSDVVIQHDVPMKTRDGVTLYADIYRPKSVGTFSVILMRTPYDKSVGWAVSPVFRMVLRGYVVIIQDVRGRYTSEGEWYPFKHEQADGFDAVEWAAALPYSDGKVGMMGGSYVGATQMLAAIAQPPHLVAIAPNVTASNYHDGWIYQGGAFEQWFDQNWTSQLAQNTLQRVIEQNTNALVGVSTLPLANYPVFNFGQLSSDAQLTATLAPTISTGLRTPTTTIIGSSGPSRNIFPTSPSPCSR